MGTRIEGLDDVAAVERLASRASPRTRRPWWAALRSQFLNPLVSMLIVAGGVSWATGNEEDAAIIFAIVLMSGGFGFVQQRAAERTVARLLDLVHARATVRRGGSLREVRVEHVVEGDVVLLSVGATVPADARVLEAAGLQVDESALTGESFPVEKRMEPSAPDATLRARSSALFQGTHVVSGTGAAVVVATGTETELGRIRGRLVERRPPTDFDLGLQRFGNLLASVSLGLVSLVLVVNLAHHRPPIEALLFSVALAVGLVPELLPAIVTVSLARGAKRMAEREVICKRLSGIEDFGAVDVLCSDKTGTLTQGRLALTDAIDLDGAECADVRMLAMLNAAFESGYDNPIDQALRRSGPCDTRGWELLGEVPYDFVRKRLSVLLLHDGRQTLVTKGQVSRVVDACTRARTTAGTVALAAVRPRVERTHHDLARVGKRTLAVAMRELAPGEVLDRDAERDMVFCGFVAFSDPLKPDAGAVVHALGGLGVAFKIVTGDDRRVAAHVWAELTGSKARVVSGSGLPSMSPDALARRATDTDVFAEIDPSQKEQVLRALRRGGHVVAYIGDGINDAPALRAADVGISVEGAADVAREAADLVLRRPDLAIVLDGIREGRRTMVNTLKYVHYTTSANFGNMVSMAGASLFLPFLPLLPKQILVNNFLSDFPAFAIAADRVGASEIARPRRWRNDEIRRFMLVFGALSSVFDALMFLLLFFWAAGAASVFRTGWFIGSLLTEVLVLLALRTREPIGRSPPSPLLTWSIAAIAAAAILLPYAPVAAPLQLVRLPIDLLAGVVLLSVAYTVATEALKRWFFRERRSGAS
jgi:Mg2+-importing ATPase